ncbi:hypothetical protein MJO28_014223 [Puccinia striiformis f. sp. tritici]|uniref:Uncharacterized protein n=1 Tax=Puccinia striiformis f. sp. tritici TaxID=168172 RepID=A0ACC0DSX8_9BASI|nr:hypothetical protein MJO28_014223 [Puccinia striiformis f. sp. tritici]
MFHVDMINEVSLDAQIKGKVALKSQKTKCWGKVFTARKTIVQLYSHPLETTQGNGRPTRRDFRHTKDLSRLINKD